jgi:hypothetical protein
MAILLRGTVSDYFFQPHSVVTSMSDAVSLYGEAATSLSLTRI